MRGADRVGFGKMAEMEENVVNQRVSCGSATAVS